jgi:hypothetical protein
VAGGALRVDRKCTECADDDRIEVQRQPAAGATPGAGHRFAEISVHAPQAVAPAAPTERMAISEPEDAGEQEAERAAVQVMRTLATGEPPDDGPLGLTITRPLVQRAVDNSAEPTPQPAEAGLLVDDEAVTTQPGQMRKTDFLRVLRPAVCAAAERELARVGRNTDGCPYLDRWFNYYQGRPPQQVERSLRKYAPETAHARTAGDYLGPVSARIAARVRRWVDTGEVPEVPDGVSLDEPGGGVLDTLAGVGSAIGSAVASGISAVGSFLGKLFFKARPGGAGRGAPGGAPLVGLGEGQPLETTARSRMGAAFGYDFGSVRVHTDASAAALADSMNARAFTVGTHVAFGAGQYRPGELAGDALLAHELAHVMQQGGASAEGPLPAPSQHDTVEQDADRAAVGAMLAMWSGDRSERTRRDATPNHRSGLRLQRCVHGQTPAVQQVPSAPQLPLGPVSDAGAASPMTASQDVNITSTTPRMLQSCGLVTWPFQLRLPVPAAASGWIVQHITFERNVYQRGGTIRKYPRLYKEYWEIWPVEPGATQPGSLDLNNARVPSTLGYDDEYAALFDPTGRVDTQNTQGDTTITAQAKFYVGTLTAADDFRRFRTDTLAGSLPSNPNRPGWWTDGGTTHNMALTWDCTTGGGGTSHVRVQLGAAVEESDL